MIPHIPSTTGDQVGALVSVGGLGVVTLLLGASLARTGRAAETARRLGAARRLGHSGVLRAPREAAVRLASRPALTAGW